ncbi:uncharacterized protein BP5553_02792 [Venustampulla echinocandica]|uniref:Uncharacterized protein n=1 Tax=Venustampulla echinocandica TaxID=2656787 RepID=A0A370TSE2_9HELO|nr:uncharacterized protein BP5553_02792 [Venustampulla echinocandica]RDL38452.1 hypothetical protein BP5553_02792 [Venustampulla echinocandica]
MAAIVAGTGVGFRLGEQSTRSVGDGWPAEKGQTEAGDGDGDGGGGGGGGGGSGLRTESKDQSPKSRDEPRVQSPELRHAAGRWISLAAALQPRCRAGDTVQVWSGPEVACPTLDIRQLRCRYVAHGRTPHRLATGREDARTPENSPSPPSPPTPPTSALHIILAGTNVVEPIEDQADEDLRSWRGPEGLFGGFLFAIITIIIPVAITRLVASPDRDHREFIHTTSLERANL